MSFDQNMKIDGDVDVNLGLPCDPEGGTVFDAVEDFIRTVEGQGRLYLYTVEVPNVGRVTVDMSDRSIFKFEPRCTGYDDPDSGLLRHDGDTCPIHEA